MVVLSNLYDLALGGALLLADQRPRAVGVETPRAVNGLHLGLEGHVNGQAFIVLVHHHEHHQRLIVGVGLHQEHWQQ